MPNDSFPYRYSADYSGSEQRDAIYKRLSVLIDFATESECDLFIKWHGYLRLPPVPERTYHFLVTAFDNSLSYLDVTGHTEIDAAWRAALDQCNSLGATPGMKALELSDIN